MGPPSPAPWDSGSEATASAALLNRENSLAGIRGNLRFQQEQLGIGEFASSPYSRSAELGRERDIGNRTNLNTAGLKLYSGSTVARGRSIAGAYDRGRHQLETDWTLAQEEAKQREQEAQGEFEDTLAQSREGAIGRAMDEPPEPEPLPGQPRRRRRRGRGR